MTEPFCNHDWVGDDRCVYCRNEELEYEIIMLQEQLRDIMDNPHYCHSAMDGECFWEHCPQLRDKEPEKTGRHCPLDVAFPTKR